MATLYGSQWSNAFVSVPSVEIGPGDISGSVKFLYFDYTVPAIAPSNNDIVKLAKIPIGARILNAVLSFPDLGTVGVVELGWAASAALDSAGSPVEAASASGFLAGVDVHTAAAIVSMTAVTGAAVAGHLKKFTAECDLQMKVTTAWDAVSGTVKGYLTYVVI